MYKYFSYLKYSLETKMAFKLDNLYDSLGYEAFLITIEYDNLSGLYFTI